VCYPSNAHIPDCKTLFEYALASRGGANSCSNDASIDSTQDRLQMIYSSTIMWADYVDALPNCEQIVLLQHIQFVDRAQLLGELRTAQLLLLALDGGAHSLQGSFGCLLATQETILLDCGGRVYGLDPRSFRAEGYGMLTILRLVHHIRYFYVTGNSALKFRLYCDSDSLIKRLQGSLALCRPAPR
jgi:hypothetical protein